MGLTVEQVQNFKKVNNFGFSNVRDPRGRRDPLAAWRLEHVVGVYAEADNHNNIHLELDDEGLISRDDFEKKYRIRFDVEGNL